MGIHADFCAPAPRSIEREETPHGPPVVHNCNAEAAQYHFAPANCCVVRTAAALSTACPEGLAEIQVLTVSFWASEQSPNVDDACNWRRRVDRVRIGRHCNEHVA